MEKILIVGGNSFLGKELIELLLPKNVTAVYHQNQDKLSTTHVNKISVTDLNLLKDDFSIVYFISAFIPKDKNLSDNENLYKVNIELLQQCLIKFTKAKFVLASSVSVYGEDGGILTENSRFKNVNNYGLSKLWAENLVKQHPSYSIIRISSMYGEGMNQITFLPKIIRGAIDNKEINLFGDGTRKQNYIHVNDVAKMMIKSAERKDNKIYLAVNSLSHSNLYLAELIKKHLKNITIKYIGTDTSPSFIYDASNTYKDLFEPQKKIESEINDLIQWIKK